MNTRILHRTFQRCSVYVFMAVAILFRSFQTEAQTITLTSQETMWLDANNCNSSGPQGAWLSFTITNNTAATLTNVVVTFAGFTGTNAAWFVAPHDLVRTFTSLAVGDVVPVYYYVDYSAVCAHSQGGGNPYGGYTANYTLTVSATGITSVVRNGTITTNNLLSASAAGIASSVTLGSGFYVGQLLTETVVYTFGNNSDLFFQPAGEAGFQDACIRLVGSECTATSGGVTGILGTKNQLYFPSASVPGGGGTITIQYTWEIICINTAQTIHPWAAAKSGNKYKYEGYVSTIVYPPITASTQSVGISKSVSPTFFSSPTANGGYGAGIAQWTVTLSNSGTVDVIVSSITDMIPSCMTVSNATASGSGVTASNSASVPSVGSTGTQTWTGKSGSDITTSNYKVPASGMLSLLYQTNVSSCATPAMYTNSATAKVGTITVGPATAITTICGTVTYGTVASGDQSVCNGTIPSAMSVSGATGSGTFSYQWYYQDGIVTCPTGTSTSGWTSLGSANGANTTTYTPPTGLTSSRTYACFVTPGPTPTCGTATWSTGCRKVTVYNTVNYGTLSSADEGFCNTGDPSNITFSTAPSGGAGTFNYQWYYKDGLQTCPSGTSTSGWTLISGATSASYDPPSGLTASRTYAVMVDATGSPDCGGATWANGCRKVTINTPPTTAYAGTDQSLCSSTLSASLAANTPIVGTGSWSVVSGPSLMLSQFSSLTNPSATFTAAGGTGTYVLRWTISNPPCPASTSDMSVTFNTVPTITGTTPGSRCDAGTVTLYASASAGTIDWYSTPSDGTSLHTGTSYTTPVISSTTTYYVNATYNGCVSIPRTAVTATIYETPVLTDPSDQALCNGAATEAVNFISTVPGTNYSWTNDNTGIGLASSGTGNIASFYAVNSGGTTQVATVTVTPGIDGCPGTAQSFTITVYPTPSIEVTPSSQTLCSGGAVSIGATNPNSVSGATFSWTRTSNPQLTGMPLSGSGVPVSGHLVSSSSGTSQSTEFTIMVSANGCSSQGTSTVTIYDNTKPEITCPGAKSVPANLGCYAVGVSLGTPVTSDNCVVATVINNAPASFPPGLTTITWTVTDSAGNSATCTQDITVTNTSPAATDDTYDMLQNTTASPTSVSGNVLLNDNDPEGQSLHVTSWGSPAGGTLNTNSDGSFTYTPITGYTGLITFDYTVCDACNDCDSATVNITVKPCLTTPPAPAIIRKP